MKILHIHNHHASRGGVEVVYEYCTRLLRQRGHEVIELTRDSASLKTPLAKLSAFATGIYNPRAGREAKALIASNRPDVALVHNLYPMLSTAVFDACHAAGIPVIMYVHDYKLTCPMGRHVRNGARCMKCLEKSVAWSAIHSCKGGRLESTAYAISHGITRLRGGYQRGVDLFITPARFTADYLATAGFDPAKIMVVPNMCDLPSAEPSTEDGEYVAFVGRISEEKGIDVLIDAARQTGLPTRIAGGGETSGYSLPDNAQFVGPVSRSGLPAFYQRARFLVVPSTWDEVFGVVAVEAMLHGIPVIASKAGGLAEVFQHEQSGLYVPPGDSNALAQAMNRLWSDPALCRRMGLAAREYALLNYTPDVFYGRLMQAFGRVLKNRTTPAPQSTIESTTPPRTEAVI